MDVDLTPSLQPAVPSHEERILSSGSLTVFPAASPVVQVVFWMCACSLYLSLIALPFIFLFLLTSSWLAEGISFICVFSAFAILTHKNASPQYALLYLSHSCLLLYKGHSRS